jgi:hypothetical protein
MLILSVFLETDGTSVGSKEAIYAITQHVTDSQVWATAIKAVFSWENLGEKLL